MNYQAMKPFFSQYTIWMHDNALYWYETMWNHLIEANLIKVETDKEKQRSYLYAFVLVDLYGVFSQYSGGESLDREQYDYDSYFNFDYYTVCNILDIETVKLEDFINPDELREGEDPEAFIEYPQFSDLFYHVNEKLRADVLSVLKQHYSKTELFALLGQTIRDDYPKNLVEYKEFSNQYVDEILNDCDLIRAFEWWDWVC